MRLEPELAQQMSFGPHDPPPVPRAPATPPDVPPGPSPTIEPPDRLRLRRARSAAKRALPFGSGILAALVVVLLYNVVNPGPAPLDRGAVASQIAAYIASQPPAPPLAALAYAVVHPSLVIVEAERAAPDPSASPGGSPGTSPAPSGELGSGVVVNASGEVLTALHVVSGATAIRVTFADGSTSPATLASSEPDSDIAVLQPDSVPASATPAVLGNPGSLRIGSDAFVTGNPYCPLYAVDDSVLASRMSAVRTEGRRPRQSPDRAALTAKR